MVSRRTTEAVFTTIKSYPENDHCFDCNAADTSFALMSMAIFLCPNCAETHRWIEADRNSVRSLSQDTWSIKQLQLLSGGGNAKLKEFFAAYSIPHDISVESKYCLVAAEYYRGKISALRQDLPYSHPPPSVEDGLRPAEVVHSVPEPSKQSRLGSLFSSAMSITRKAAHKLSEKAHNVKTSTAFQSVSSTAFTTISTFGLGLQAGAEWTADKGKAITSHLTLQAAVSSVKSAVSTTVTRIQENETIQKVTESTSNALGLSRGSSTD